jgi:hypothetical protein
MPWYCSSWLLLKKLWMNREIDKVNFFLNGIGLFDTSCDAHLHSLWGWQWILIL